MYNVYTMLPDELDECRHYIHEAHRDIEEVAKILENCSYEFYKKYASNLIASCDLLNKSLEMLK